MGFQIINLKQLTKPIRHRIVKVIAPTLYNVATSNASIPRPMIEKVKIKFGNTPLIGAEIGVFKGINAESILSILNMKCLYLIDPYTEYSTQYAERSQETLTKSFNTAWKRLKRFSNKVVWVRLSSEEAANGIPDDLDFVYIDGNHAYESVKMDLEKYYPKVKDNGIIGGHDFILPWDGVVKAVVDYCINHNLKFELQYPSDWWIEKCATVNVQR